MAAVLVQQRELVGEQAEDLRVRIGGLEQPRDRIAPPRRGIERDRVVAHGPVGGDRIHAGHGEQLAAPLMEHCPDVEERLQARTEPAARAAHALGNRAHASVARGVQVQDAVGLAVANRAQNDGLGLQRSCH